MQIEGLNTMPSLSREVTLSLAWIIALIASLTVLFIGEILGQTPCVLCWFQRAFMFPLAIILGFGLWWKDRHVGRYGVVLAMGGAGVALWHLGLYVGLIPERIQPCTATGPSCTDDNQLVFGIPIPLLAFVAFTLIGALSAFSLKEAIK
jgi:disulfide bond formation protein DsbB